MNIIEVEAIYNQLKDLRLRVYFPFQIEKLYSKYQNILIDDKFVDSLTDILEKHGFKWRLI